MLHSLHPLLIAHLILGGCCTTQTEKASETPAVSNTKLVETIEPKTQTPPAKPAQESDPDTQDDATETSQNSLEAAGLDSFSEVITIEVKLNEETNLVLEPTLEVEQTPALEVDHDDSAVE
jgi:hypothetical protein